MLERTWRPGTGRETWKTVKLSSPGPQNSEPRFPGECLHPHRPSSLTPHPGPPQSLTPAAGGTLLLLGIIHADLKDGGPLAAQKGHGGGGAACAPF